MSVQQFCLRWNNHQPNFISVCSSLLHNGTLVDVTLAAEGRQLQAHKIVLSACSSYFQTLFTSNPCQHPIVILKDVQYDDLKTMVDFMYYGEVNVSQEQLPHILKTAEMLKIKGLAEMPTDPANLTKSDNKSSNEHTELIGSAAANVAQDLGSGGAGGSIGGGGISVGDTLWGAAESQFQQQSQQQPQQQQQQQHQQQQQQQQQHQQQQQQQHQQAQHHHQQPQQQQQQHHHHHHHQQQHQQQSSQTQTTQHHQLRRTPSPMGAGASPAIRRKRIRKSSNNGNFSINPPLTCQFKTCFKGERNNPEDQHNTSIDPNSAAGGITLSQMSQMSFAAGGGTSGAGSLAGLGGHTLHTTKLLKETTSADLETHPQDSDSLDEQHSHMHMQIKPEVDIGGVPQSIPLDISAATTPSEHDAPNSQSAHSDELPLTADVPPANDSVSASTSLQQPMGSKRNRILTRQPRVKRDSDTIANNLTSPDPVSEQTALLEPETYSISSYNPDTSQYHRAKLVSRSARIERHASEPTPSMTPTPPNLLTASTSTPAPQLIKQHSDPLIRSQANQHYLPLSTINTSDNQADINNPNTSNYALSSLQRQYSHQISLTSHTDNSGSEACVDATTSLYQAQSYQAPPSEQVYSSTSCISPPEPPMTHERREITSSSADYIVTSETNTGLDTGTYITIERLSPIMHIEATYPAPPASTVATTLPTKSCPKRPAVGSDNFSNSKLKLCKSASAAETTSPTFERRLPTLPTLPKLPTMRMKCEELQRSLSSPQTSREFITLENPRSSHCPAIRPGPALGCNFCWNTIDGHNRILRRKTKYHCPECQTNLCIVPCFQEYHERLNNETDQPSKSNSSAATSSNGNQKGSTTATTSTGGSGVGNKSRNQASKQEST